MASTKTIAQSEAKGCETCTGARTGAECHRSSKGGVMKGARIAGLAMVLALTASAADGQGAQRHRTVLSEGVRRREQDGHVHNHAPSDRSHWRPRIRRRHLSANHDAAG